MKSLFILFSEWLNESFNATSQESSAELKWYSVIITAASSRCDNHSDKLSLTTPVNHQLLPLVTLYELAHELAVTVDGRTSLMLYFYSTTKRTTFISFWTVKITATAIVILDYGCPRFQNPIWIVFISKDREHHSEALDEFRDVWMIVIFELS